MAYMVKVVNNQTARTICEYLYESRDSADQFKSQMEKQIPDSIVMLKEIPLGPEPVNHRPIL